jgi:hypothetical protein
MSRSLMSMIGPRKRIAILASACAVATAGALALVGTTSAGAATSAVSGATPSCSDASLNGTYTFGATGFSVSQGVSTPVSTGGIDHFNGAGNGTGLATFDAAGVVANSDSPVTSTYTVNADCAGKVVFDVAGSLAHFNMYVSPSGDSFILVDTDPGNVLSGTETRVGR